MKLFAALLLLAAAASALPPLPNRSQRIVGGSITNIANYPFGVALLRGSGNNFRQSCGGTIISNKSVLSAAHCFIPPQPANWRVRVGSTNANSGGVVHNTQRILNHPGYNRLTLDNDVSILRITNTFSFNNNVRAASIAGANDYLADNAQVWAIGWGRTAPNGPASEQLRHVQVWVVNQAVCRSRYATISRLITDNMLCSGWLDVGGRDQCQGDFGGPLIHNNVIVGVTSWGESCALPFFPGVNARVSRYSNWIRNNA